MVSVAARVFFKTLIFGTDPDASAALLDGLDETFTVNKSGLPPALTRGLSTTNIIENPNGALHRVAGGVRRYRDADMALRWTAAGGVELKKHLRMIPSVSEL